jgi:hypothetical protein
MKGDELKFIATGPGAIRDEYAPGILVGDSNVSEPPCETWETLVPYLQFRIESAQEMIRQVNEIMAEEDRDGAEELENNIRQNTLAPLQWFVPLVAEMLRRPAVQILTPMLSLQTIRLFRSEKGSALRDDQEFAWIEAVDEGVYRLRNVRYKGDLHWDTELVCEGGLLEIAEYVERIAEVL